MLKLIIMSKKIFIIEFITLILVILTALNTSIIFLASTEVINNII